MRIDQLLGRVGLAVLLAFICSLLGYAAADMQGKAAFNELYDTFESHLEEAETVKNKNQSLAHAIAGMDTENEDLKSLIAELEVRPTQIRYITRTETVIEASDPVFITPDLPDEFLFTLDPGLVVGRFAHQDQEYLFETYDLSFLNSMIVAENKTSASLQVATSYDQVWHEIPIEVTVTNIREQKLFEPHIGIGLTVGVPTGAVTGSLYTTLLHPSENLDLLGIRVGINNDLAVLGVDPLGYNIGANLPVLTDLWLTAGPSLNTNGNLAIDLTAGSKF